MSKRSSKKTTGAKVAIDVIEKAFGDKEAKEVTVLLSVPISQITTFELLDNQGTSKSRGDFGDEDHDDDEDDDHDEELTLTVSATMMKEF